MGRQSAQLAIAADYYFKSAEAFESIGDLNNLMTIYYQLGVTYSSLEMYAKALENNEKQISIAENINDKSSLSGAFLDQAGTLYKLKRYDEARKSMALALQNSTGRASFFMQANSNILEGKILMDQEKYSDAIPCFQKGIAAYLKLDKFSTQWSIYSPLILMAECYLRIGDLKNALKYSLESYNKEYENFEKREGAKGRINFLISEVYFEMGQPEKAFDYLKAYLALTADANKTENANKVAEAEIRSMIDKNKDQINQFEKERILKIQQSKIQRVWIFSITGALLSALLVAFILYRNNKNKQKANKILETTLSNLKATQSQLIQSEKMASLGELTAGIAHEIQNPLNFVNNFSEVSNELMDEMKEEMANGNMQLANEIVEDIKQNLIKINHHGKRAADIVKGMLQHSRTSSGVKEPTDINALADEYLRLAYHGLRAKDKSLPDGQAGFNADFVTDFDETLPKINVIPQDIGRVLLNLINNAFYAVNEKRQSNNEGYEPVVSIGTKKLGNKVVIMVKDNGNGIPKSVLDKIFQPFFTTKPTGQGTGLGLSLSYDIVKAHGGEITVETKEGEGTTFIFQIPFL